MNDLEINNTKLKVADASLPMFDKQIWYRPMNVEPYKEPLDIISNSELKKNNLEIAKSDNSSTIFTISTTNNKLINEEGTNCSSRKIFLNLTKLPDINKKYKHKFVFKILTDENGISLNALIYKSGPKIIHDKCGANYTMEFFEDEIEEEYYLWAISFSYKKNYTNTTTISEEFFEFGDISKIYLFNDYFKKKLPSEIEHILILQDKPDPNNIYTYNHIQTEWRPNYRMTSYVAQIELIKTLIDIFKFDPNEIYTTPDIIPFVFPKDPENKIKLVVKISLDTDFGSNTFNIYRRIYVGILSTIWGAIYIFGFNPLNLAVSALKFTVAYYMLSVRKSNKVDNQLREKLINEGIIHAYQMEMIENYQDNIDKVLDNYREQNKMIEPKKYVGGKSKKPKKPKKSKKSKKSKKPKRKTTKRKSRKSKR